MIAPGSPALRTTPRKAIGWTIAFLASGVVLSVLLFAALGSLVTVSPDQFLLAALLQAAAMLAAFGLLTWLVGLRGARLSVGDLRWAPPAEGIPGFGKGLLAGALPAMVALALGVVAGSASWQDEGGSLVQWSSAVSTTGAVLLPAALAEEVIFRGVPLVLLAAAFGRWPAAIGLSVLFAAAHLLNPEVGPLALANIGLAGVFLSACFYLPGGLWTATGAHLGWNLTLAALAAPVSGLPLPVPLLDYLTGGPGWLTGGAFGPEGGLVATLALGGATLVVLRRLPKEGLA